MEFLIEDIQILPVEVMKTLESTQISIKSRLHGLQLFTTYFLTARNVKKMKF